VPGDAGNQQFLADRATLATDERPVLRAALSRRDGEARDGTDGGQRLAPESERRDGLEVGVGRELGGRVARQREVDLVSAHSRSRRH
jgi:hypothetical protein